MLFKSFDTFYNSAIIQFVKTNQSDLIIQFQIYMIYERRVIMDKNLFAVNPPMGWNSWDCYGASVTEEDLIRNADYMAEHLKPMAGNTLYAIFSGRSDRRFYRLSRLC